MINLALGSFPGRSPRHAMQHASRGVFDALFGDLQCAQIQICPQNCIEKLTPEICDELMTSYPETKFRLHANVRILDKHIPVADLSHCRLYWDYFVELAQLSRRLHAEAYTLHAGTRTSSLNRMLDNLKKIEDLFGVPVGMEGMYPTPRRQFAFDTWEEYRFLLDSGAKFALDLSHLNIVANYFGKTEIELTREMLASENCIEIHVSSNDGTKDQHIPFAEGEKPWWMECLSQANPDAVIFYEGIDRRRHQAVGMG